MRAPIQFLSLALLWSLALRADSLQAAPCTVPGTHASLAAAVADPSCNPITLGAGDFAGSVTVNRSVTISGAGITTRLLGLPEREVLTLTNNATVQLQGMDLLVHADTLASKAITKAGGSSVSMVNVRIATAGQVAPLPPLDDAIALWNFANPADSLGHQSDFEVLGTFSVGNPVVLPPGFAANADGFAASEGPAGNCATSYGELYDPAPTHELVLAAGGSMTMWARVRMDGLDALDDIFRFGSAHFDTPGTYELELSSQSAQFSVLGAGNGAETHVVHGAVLFPGNWYDIAGVFDASAHQLRVYVHDPENGQAVGTPASVAAPFSSLGLDTLLNLLFLEAPYNANGCNLGGQLEGAAVWNRALSAEEVRALSQGPGVLFRDGFETGNTSAWSASVP